MLQFVGAFAEFGYVDRPSLVSVRGQRPPANKDKVVAYLKAGAPLVISPRIARDAFEPNRSAGPLHILTDGVFAWHEVLAYYVDRYDIVISSEFERWMMERGFCIPEGLVTRDLQLPDAGVR